MMRERPRPRMSAVERASTAAAVTAVTPCTAAAIDASTADQIIAERSTEELPPAIRPGLLLLPPLPPGPGPPPLPAPPAQLPPPPLVGRTPR